MNSRGVAAPLCVLSLLLVVASSSRTRADWQPSGRLSVPLHMDFQGEELRLGSGIQLDLHQLAGPLGVGFVAGVHSLTLGDDDDNRVFAPLGLSLSLGTHTAGNARHAVDLSVVARGGLWAGATNQGIAAGPFVSGGMYLDIRLDDALFIVLGVDIWALFTHGTRIQVSPTLGLQWRLADQ